MYWQLGCVVCRNFASQRALRQKLSIYQLPRLYHPCPLTHSKLFLDCWSTETGSTLCDPETMCSSFGYLDLILDIFNVHCRIHLKRLKRTKSKLGGFPLILHIFTLIRSITTHMIILDCYGRVSTCIYSRPANEDRRSKEAST